jgi:DNA-binding transcriptional MocR family regulator
MLEFQKMESIGNVMKFTIADLKKELAKRTKEQIIQEISTLCQRFPQVREYYRTQADDTDDIVKKYKEIIEKEFIEGKARGFPKARLSVARKSVNDFKKITSHPNLIADVMFTYVESISSFCSDFNPDTEEYYTSSENMFEEVLALLKKNGAEKDYERRAYKIVENATDSYGHFDSLQGRYEEIYGDFEKIS